MVKHKLETINEITEVSVQGFVRRQVILDKVDSAWGIKRSWEIGMQMPTAAVAGIRSYYEQPDTRGDEK